MKKVVYVDMDNVLVNFKSAIKSASPEELVIYNARVENIPGIFARMDPMPGAVAAFNELAELFDAYILSTAPWDNPSAWSDKLLWVKKYLGDLAVKRLILSHHKNLNRGDFIIDDRTLHGVDLFQGKHIHFGTPEFPDWFSVVQYLREKV